MLRHDIVRSCLDSRNFTIALVQLMALGVIILPLAGCSDDGTGGPNISSLSTPTDTPSSEVAKSKSDPTAVGSTGEGRSTILTTAEATAIETTDSDSVGNLPGHDPELDPVVDSDVDPTVSCHLYPDRRYRTVDLGCVR